MTYRRCINCDTKRDADEFRDGNFITCPACGFSYRVRLGRELSETMDAYAEGRTTAEHLVQASFDQEFTDIIKGDSG